MTYAEFAKIISKMTEEQKQCDVTVLLTDANEFLSAEYGGVNAPADSVDNFDQLDEDHPYLMVDW
jgi:hypothetical protein